MKQSSIIRSVLLAGCLAGLAASPVIAVEVITEEDLIEGIVVTEQLVPLVDNAIVLFDTSTSMNDKFRDTGESKLSLVESEFIKRNGYFPNIDINFGLYSYTPWKELSPVQPYNRETLAAALQALPEKGMGATPMKKGLKELEDILDGLSGRTAVFLFSDGEYTGGNPSKTAKKLATNYDVCFYVISTAKENIENTLKEDVADLNACSRVIPLEYFLDRPEYTTGLLFDVLATEQIVTVAETKVVGLKENSINFAFDKSELTDQDKAQLDELGEFMVDKPDSYAVIAGYTDNTGPEDRNEALSRERAEMVADYMTEAHGIDESRMVLHWYGSDNPMASNDTPEGRATNRRVEMAIGL